jgi:LmbE family N-acetylglucosaminyl deacetylase
MGRTIRRFLRTFQRETPTTHGGLWQACAYMAELPREWEPGAQRVLVLAPHMDDEVIGCGGTIARHIAAGATVDVVFLTDGRFGHPRVYRAQGAEREKAARELMTLRKQEAQHAQGELGVSSLRFLDAVDTLLAGSRRVETSLGEILRSLRPDIVYLPHFLEHHPDHRAASTLLLAAAEQAGVDFECCGYEVWTPLCPNRIVRIDDTVMHKDSAMAQYRSQLEGEKDLLRAMQGLAAFRARWSPNGNATHAECFFALHLHDYRAAHAAFNACRG